MSMLLSKGNPSTLLGKGNDLGTVSFGLGWDVSHWQGSADVDASVMYVTGDPANEMTLRAASHDPLECFYFFRNLRSMDGAVRHYGDDRTGQGPGIDERIDVDTRLVPRHITGVIAFVNINEGTARNQELNELKNAFFRIDDQHGRTLAQRDIDAEFPDMRSACVGGLFRDPMGNWSARYLSRGSHGELATLLPQFGLQVA